MFEVNDECGSVFELSLWRAHVVGHEREHRDSYNECVRSGWELQNATAELEAVAGQTVRDDARKVYDKMREILSRAAQAGIGPQTMPDGMWYWRYRDTWENIPRTTKGHGGQRGCP